MEQNYWIIKVKDEMGNFYNNAFIENDFDAVRVAKFYRDQMGYDIQLWHAEKDMSWMLNSESVVVVKE